MNQRMHLSENTSKILETLCQMVFATAEGRYIKIDNTNETFMPVSVEVVGELAGGKVIAVSHYYKQNGDMIPDPTMTFYRNENGLYPGLPSFTPLDIQDSIGYRESAKIENGKLAGIYPKRMADLISFTSMWMKNIKCQQEIKLIKFNKPEDKAPSVVSLHKEATKVAKSMGYGSLNDAFKAGKTDDVKAAMIERGLIKN